MVSACLRSASEFLPCASAVREGLPGDHFQQRCPVHQTSRARARSKVGRRADDDDRLGGIVPVRGGCEQLARRQEHVRHDVPVFEAFDFRSGIPGPPQRIGLAGEGSFVECRDLRRCEFFRLLRSDLKRSRRLGGRRSGANGVGTKFADPYAAIVRCKEIHEAAVVAAGHPE